jgi:transcriptional regulator with XRE-family HTH domain
MTCPPARQFIHHTSIYAAGPRQGVSVLFDLVPQRHIAGRLALSTDVRICEELRGPRARIAGGAMSDNNLSDEQSRQIADLIREELARRRISRKGLAGRAKISISTLEKVLSGRRPFTLATTIRLEEALGVTLRVKQAAPAAPAQNLAPGEFGYYARPAVSWIEGSYLTLRPSFGDPDAIYAYRVEIAWDDQCSSLVFHESERIDVAFTQAGTVSVPNQSGHIYLVTNSSGQYRLLIVSRPIRTGEMYGILTTLQSTRGSHLMPVSAPVAMIPTKAVKDIQFGQIRAADRCYALYRRYLRRTVDDQFAVFLKP